MAALVAMLIAVVILLAAVTSSAAAQREVRVGTWSYPPQVSLDAQGRPVGIFVDIVDSVGARNDWRITYVFGTWEDTLSRLESGEIDLGLGVGQVALRRAQFDLNKEPVVSDWGQIFTREDDRIETILDLESKTVVGWRDDRTYRSLRRLARTFGVTARYLATNSIDDNFAMVQSGEADAVVDLRIPGRIYEKKYGLVASPVLFSPITFGFATTKGRNADLLQQVDAFIREGKGDSASPYGRITEKWLGVSPEVRSHVPRYVLAIIVGVAFLAALFVAMSFLLKHQVDRRTRALRSERDMVRRLMETSPVGIALVAADGAVSLTNKRAEELLGPREGTSGSAAEPATGRREAADPGAPSGALQSAADQVLGTREPVHGMLLTVNAEDGRRVMLSVNGAPVFGEDGELSGALTAFVDVTGRERAREEIEQHRERLAELVRQRTAELEATNEELESFSYSVSHDLRAPLRALDGFSLALLEDAGDELGEESRDYLVRIRRASQRMAELIDALLKLSRVGRVEVARTEVDVSAAAERAVKDLVAGAPERDAEWSVETGLTARADPVLTDVVLENLIGNAWKFTAGRAPARIDFGAFAGDDERVFFVRDNGVGFDPAYVDKLFRPFERLHTADEFPGTGIGLATVRRAIVRQGGRCWAEGSPGEGATFFFTL